MSGFIEWLESLNAKDTKVRAVLRRSLAFDPGGYVEAYPYVEPFLKDEDNLWRRKAHYLVAGLWGLHWRQGRGGAPVPIGRACALHGTESVERRLIALLDSDPDQLPHRLRQMVSLLKEQPLDFNNILAGLLRWNDLDKKTQNAWARDYYRNVDANNNPKEENV